MSQSIQVNGQTINYPETGDTNWSDDATNFAIQTSAALGKIGLSSGTSVDITQTLDVTGNTTLDANLSVGGNASITGNTTLTGNLTVNGNTQLGNANTDTIGVTGIVNIDSGVLYVDPVNNRVGINKITPAQALDVVGDFAVSGNETVGGTLGITGDVAINTNKFNVTASSGNTTIAGTLGVTSDITTNGILTASNSTNVTTAPPITFTGDTNTGIGHSAADTLDLVTGGVPRARLNSTGQQSSVVPDLSASNTTLYNEYKCRAWVNFNGSLTGTNAGRGNGNVTSVTRNATGSYTLNFTTAFPDTNYACIGMTNEYSLTETSRLTTSLTIKSWYVSNTAGGQTNIDSSWTSVAVFR